MTKSVIQYIAALLMLVPLSVSAQITVGGTTPAPSAVVDMQSTDKGFLWPRLSTAERNAIVSPATGLLIFNTSTVCIEINQGTPSVPQWERVKCRAGVISGLDCAYASVSGLVISVPYTDGNGGFYESQVAASTGITGLEATLSAGNYAVGGGSLSWTLSGVPSSTGVAGFSLSSGGFSCIVPFTVVAGTVSGLSCSSATVTGTLTPGQAASGVSASVPYTGGNGGFHNGQTVASTGVTGLTATLSAGSFESGSGNLSYSITGTPAGGGTASFALNIGGQTCIVDICVNYVCRAKVNATDYRDFMCHNLGAANTCADPFTPTWEINGGYWQWGRLAQAAAGPTGPGAGDANDGPVSGWNTTDAPDGSWTDGAKTPNDPCPAGYRVPTKAQWDGVVANNPRSNVGSFYASPTNYGEGVKFGDDLMLPAAGFRDSGNGDDGTLYFRGDYGFYWSTKESSSTGSWGLYFGSDEGTNDNIRTLGFSVRCIADIPGTIGTLNCGGATITGTLTPGQAASGVSASVPYTGGDGGPHSGQTVASTGVTGLTATLSSGSFVSGSGNLSYSITGTPASIGTASFALNIGGQTCMVDICVNYVCRAKVNATDYRDFMCHNLGAANTCADPFTPTWEINGGYWQWGRLAQAAAGPTGPGAGDANSGAVSGWNATGAPSGSWTDATKTANDPCPSGYRVPTKAQWDGVLANNTITNTGSFGTFATNYGAGKKFGDQLMLPAAGYRDNVNGALSDRGNLGIYWSSTEGGSGKAWYLNFYNIFAGMANDNRAYGFSVRCIADTPGTTGALDCGGATITGTLTPGQAASGVSASVPYTGGNGGFHNGQTVASTGVTGLTATLSAGSFESGSGNLLYSITGTPASGGTASFALNIGGQTCMLNVFVNYVCRAKVNATDYKDFMCYNLGSANTSADPFTPTWEINGGYWQWGRLAQAVAGPTGPGAGAANSGAVSGWNTTGAPNGSWTDATKTANDPCPAGYRVPTKAQWDGVIANNTPVNMGSFSDSPVNYGAGIKLGNDLMLPVAGARLNLNGFTVYRGLRGYYWSSTEGGGGNAGGLELTNTTASTVYDVRAFGTSIRCIADIPGTIGSLNCDGTTTGTFASGKSASGVSASVPYTGGDGGPHSGQTVASTGVTGLTATLSAGSFVSGSGNLLYSITGTPASGGTASFALNIGGQTCTMNIFVCGGCCAKVSPTETREFMCHNLGSANTGADPFTPTWEINGGYWQWGRLAQAAAGPTGPGAGDANAGAVSGWNTTYAPDGSWADGSKTANDPCPAGYRIPTKAQWDGVIANNTVSSLGTFSTSVTNYGAGVKFSNQLMLPAAGGRYYDLSTLYSRGLVSYYWSSTEYTTGRAWGLGFSSTVGGTNHDYRTYGTSVRCIADTPGTTGALDCGGATITGTLTPGQAASGVSASVPYTGGNGGFHNGQTVASTGVTGLTATLSAGSFESGSGNLSYSITGTPAGGGTASFALNIGGQTCMLDICVNYVCRAKVNATDYRDFMCHNLGAANTCADPFTPTWEINGGYWQWGIKEQAAAGPIGSGSSEANDAVISGWNTTPAPNSSWADGSKTTEDPCPTGYRVPTKAQWDGVVANNTLTNVGGFYDSVTNYGAGKKFGDQLMLPAAGVRDFVNSSLRGRGDFGDYRSSTEYDNVYAYCLYLSSSGTYTYFDYRTYGFSVRCIAE